MIAPLRAWKLASSTATMSQKRLVRWLTSITAQRAPARCDKKRSAVKLAHTAGIQISQGATFNEGVHDAGRAAGKQRAMAEACQHQMQGIRQTSRYRFSPDGRRDGIPFPREKQYRFIGSDCREIGCRHLAPGPYPASRQNEFIEQSRTQAIGIVVLR